MVETDDRAAPFLLEKEDALSEIKIQPFGQDLRIPGLALDLAERPAVQSEFLPSLEPIRFP